MEREERKEHDPENGGVARRRFSIVPRKTKAFQPWRHRLFQKGAAK
jgi:hypothetical protein